MNLKVKVENHPLMNQCGLRFDEGDPVDWARSFHSLMSINGWSETELAKQLDASPETIADVMRLYELPPSLQADVSAGRIDPAVAVELTNLNDPQDQIDCAEAIKSSEPGEYSREDVAQVVISIGEKKGKKQIKTRTIEVEGGIVTFASAMHLTQDVTHMILGRAESTLRKQGI